MADKRKREKRSAVTEAESQIQNLTNFWSSMSQQDRREFLNPGRQVPTEQVSRGVRSSREMGRQPPMSKKAALGWHLAAQDTQIGNIFLSDKLDLSNIQLGFYTKIALSLTNGLYSLAEFLAARILTSCFSMIA